MRPGEARNWSGAQKSGCVLQSMARASFQDHCHYFLVLETNKDNMLVTEKNLDGSVSMVVNPDSLLKRCQPHGLHA